MTERIIVRIEPSKRLSEILGFPYFIEKSFPLEVFGELITEADLAEMRMGKEIKKQIKVNDK